MSEPWKSEVAVPSAEQLHRIVVPRGIASAGRETSPDPPTSGGPATEPAESDKPVLSHLARAFLNHAAQPQHRELGLEPRWRALGVTSGSIKKRVLAELRCLGFVRLEQKGRYRRIHLYNKAWEYLGVAPPTGEGVGGATHRAVVGKLATLFKKRGYDVHIEHEVGEFGKRVDLVCFGKDRIIGVEVGLSDVRQEIKNLRADLESGVLDLILFVSCDPHMAFRVRAAAEADPIVSENVRRIRFLYLEEDAP